MQGSFRPSLFATFSLSFLLLRFVHLRFFLSLPFALPRSFLGTPFVFVIHSFLHLPLHPFALFLIYSPCPLHIFAFAVPHLIALFLDPLPHLWHTGVLRREERRGEERWEGGQGRTQSIWHLGRTTPLGGMFLLHAHNPGYIFFLYRAISCRYTAQIKVCVRRTCCMLRTRPPVERELCQYCTTTISPFCHAAGDKNILQPLSKRHQ